MNGSEEDTIQLKMEQVIVKIEQENDKNDDATDSLDEKDTKESLLPDTVKEKLTSVLPSMVNFVRSKQKNILKCAKTIVLLLYLTYVGYCLSVKFGDEGSWRLLVCTVLWLLYLIWGKIKNMYVVNALLHGLSLSYLTQGKARCVMRWVMYFAVSSFILVFIGVRIRYDDPRNLISVAGIVVFILILLLMSNDRTKIPWHTVYWGFALQFFFALGMLKTTEGAEVVLWLSNRFIEISDYATPGSRLIFGPTYKSFRLAFVLFPKMIVFCAVIRVLNDVGILRFINFNIGRILQFITGVTPPEAICAAANMFLSTAESALIISDYLDDLFDDQLFSVLVSGLSSLSGSVMIMYLGFGVPMSYLIAGSVMSSPAALASAKLVMPSKNEWTSDKYDKRKTKPSCNVFSSLSVGGKQGLRLTVNVGINLLLFYGLLAFLNNTVDWFGQRAGFENLSLEEIVSYLTWPCAYLMGVEFGDCSKVSRLLAVRSLSSPVVAFIRVGDLVRNKVIYNDYNVLYNDTMRLSDRDIFLPQWNVTLQNGILSERSTVISVFALAGFSSLTTIGICLGVFGALAPRKLPVVGRIVFKATITSTVASYFTACMAGLLL